MLEKKLKDAELDVNVINAGIQSATSIDERYYIEKHIIKYSPDMIIMYDGWNDVIFPWKNIPYEQFKNQTFFVNNELIDSRIGGTGIIKFFEKIDYKTGLGITSYLSNLLHNQSEVLTEQVNDENKKSSETFSNEYLSEVENRLQNNWSEICKIEKKNNFRTINILQPILGTSDRVFSDVEKYSDTTMNPYLIEFKLNNTKYQPCDEIYDLRNVFDGMDEIPIYFDDGHMRYFGNNIIAEEIYTKILPIIENDIKN